MFDRGCGAVDAVETDDAAEAMGSNAAGVAAVTGLAADGGQIGISSVPLLSDEVVLPERRTAWLVVAM